MSAWSVAAIETLVATSLLFQAGARRSQRPHAKALAGALPPANRAPVRAKQSVRAGRSVDWGGLSRGPKAQSSAQWGRPLAENVEIGAVTENASTPTACYLIDDAQTLKVGQCGVDGGRG